MSFTSLNFLIFLGLTIAAYFTVPKRIQWVILLFASWIFYLYAGIGVFLFLIATTVVTFFAGLLLAEIAAKDKSYVGPDEDAATKEEKKLRNAITRKKKRVVLSVCLLFNFGALIGLKYAAPLVATVSKLLFLSQDISPPVYSLLLPLGVSFYMFQTAGYVIDIYREKYRPTRNFLKFALFVSYFPQIIQGPIGRYDRLAHQLYTPHGWDDTRIKYGIQLALWGYFKKMVIADRAAVLVSQVFDNYAAYDGAILFISVLFYSLQIYCDFSGGIDISRGISQVLGIELDLNFKRPFFATSVADFWRRWHITLGSWLREYLFYPLSLSKPLTLLSRKTRKIFGSRAGKLIPASVATFMVYIVVGLWHGGSWKYIAFGLYNGGIIIFSLFMEPYFTRLRARLRIDAKSGSWRLFQAVRTLLLVAVARYFSRAPSFMSALSMLKRTITGFSMHGLLSGTLLNLGLTWADFLILFVSVSILFAADFLQERGIDPRKRLETKGFWAQWGTLLAILLAITFCGGIFSDGYIASEFIYGQY